MTEFIEWFLSDFWVMRMSFSTELLIAELLFVAGQPKRGHFVLRMIFGILFYCMLCWSLPFVPNGLAILFRTLPQFAFSVGLLLFLLNVPPKCSFFISLVSYALQSLAFSLSTFCCSFLEVNSLYSLLASSFISAVIFILVYITGYFLIVRPFNKNSEIYFNNLTSFLLAILTLCVTCGRMALGSVKILSDAQLLFIFTTLCVSLVLFIQFGLLKKSRVENEKRTIERLLHAEEARQSIHQETIDIINMKFHDLRYHLNKYRSAGGENANADFFADVAGAIENYDCTPDTGNSALNALLAEKLIYCNANDITLSYIIDASAIEHMSPSDISSLFGNALDNAIQSVVHEDKEKRIISISVRRHGDMGNIIISNYCARQPAMKDGLPLSSGDSSIHGFGTRSIKYIAEKYCGNMIIDFRDNMFTLSIIMTEKK